MQTSAKRRSKGFALLITITLLAFLVLLLVSLASLTRVETQVASNNQQLAQARQNALMALNIAMGQLQKYVGPDQRITARSDMADTTTPAYTTPSGRWTGAYGNGVSVGGFGNPDKYDEVPATIQDNLSNYYTANSTDPYVMKGSQARLLNWLVSGNETATFIAATSGQITTTGTGITFAPTDAVSNLTGKTSLSTDITIKNASSFARLLVGPNTVTDTHDYVAAPLVPISAVSPGLGTTPAIIGNYAWWVGDEGTKARLNLPLDTTAANKPQAFVSAQRAAIELMDAVNPNPTTTLSTGDMLDRDFSKSRYDPRNITAMSSILQGSQFPLLSPANTNFLTNTLKYRYHDVTLTSNSILADAYAGGLKKDLSAMLVKDATNPPDTRFIFKPQTNGSGEINELGLPTWGQLRSFARITAVTITNPDGSTTSQLQPEPPALVMQVAEPNYPTSTLPVATTVGVGPILTYFAIGFGVLAPDGDVAGGRISLGVYPIVVLWNPYTTALAPAKYEVGMTRDYHSKIQIQAHDGPPDATYAWSQVTDTSTTPNPNKVLTKDLGTDPAGNTYFRFAINSTKGIPPGQSVVYTLQNTGKPFLAADPNNMLTDESYNNLYCSLISLGLNIGTAPAKKVGASYRVGVNTDALYTPGASIIHHPTATKAAYTLADPIFNSSQPAEWAGNGAQWAYLSSFPGPSVKPSGSLPYYSSSGTYNSRQWYQSMSWLTSSFYNDAPFGVNVGFTSDTNATKTFDTGPDTGKWRALLQPEGLLAPGGTPAWRMHVKANFQEVELRSLTHSNSRALMSTNTRLTGNPSTYTGRNYVSTDWPPITVDASTVPARAPSAESLRNTTVIDATLFDARPDNQPLLSIGQLQHANLGWLGIGPTYSIGNSDGLPVLESSPSKAYIPMGSSSAYYNTTYTAIYDQSWLLNRVLWDKYFVSTVPNKNTGTAANASIAPSTPVPKPLPNPRHIRYNAIDDPLKLRNTDLAATQLLLSGGFNINSTSEQAWRAVLGATNQLSYDPTGNNTGGSSHSGAVFSRFSKPTTNDISSVWTGYRKLTEPQIAQLAKNIVAQVRKRGPFVSLADFINRRLYENGTFPQNDDSRIKGTLQSAIDMTGTVAINDSVAVPKFNSPLVTPGDYNSTNGKNDILPSTKSAFRNGGAYTDSSTGAVITNSKAPYSSKDAFSPQFLTQADVLSLVGSNLTARSDTFVIRTYGEVLNPTDSTQIIGRAWCEAVVQRIPEYVDTTLTPEIQLQDIPAPLTTAKIAARTTNLAFGRKFKIISFRWLSSNDI